MENPLGTYNGNATLDAGALTAARDLVSRLPDAIGIDHLYLHWTVGHYGQAFPDYNISVRYANGKFFLDETHDPRNNARSTFSPDDYAAHTWLRNSGALGIASDDMAFASEADFGPEPITHLTIEFLCAAAAACAQKYHIDLAAPTTHAPYQNEHAVMTHAEAAMTGGSPPPSAWYNYGITGSHERWDWATFVPVPPGQVLTAADATTCADTLRARIRLYKVALEKLAQP